MKIAITGHRPGKLGNDYDLTSPWINRIYRQLTKIVKKYRPDTIITGMALGIDTLWAKVGIDNSCDIIAAIPFEGQESVWPKKSQDRYHYILNHELVTSFMVSEGRYSPDKMQIRNEWMVDNADKLMAVWDGSSGGTKNCIEYAQKTIGDTNIIRINPLHYKDDVPLSLRVKY